jgi:hypothetical protein
MRCCDGFFMGNSVSDPKDLLPEPGRVMAPIIFARVLTDCGDSWTMSAENGGPGISLGIQYPPTLAEAIHN